ncbi:MAG: MBL fold metallo-hydrolase [Candidatus Heimdallarchaeota archaeon]|nr:MBL fold metallo-hydrolase [Candidatus Heimdallarchaeota archaeon]
MSYFEVTKNVVAANATNREKSKVNNAAQTIVMSCLALPDKLVFVDCGVYLDVAEKFRKDMEKKFQRKTSHLILTHTHWDHILAMKVFKDVDIVVSKKGLASLKKDLKGYLSPEELLEYAGQYAAEDTVLANDIRNADLFLPNIAAKDEFRINSGEHEILFKVIGNHTAGSAFVYYPQEKTLCAGDNLLECYPQLLDSNWKTMDLLQSWEEMDIEHVIPGHGKPVTKEYITNIQSYYNKLITFLKEQIKQDVSFKKALNNPELPEYFGTTQSDWYYACRPTANWLTVSIEGWYKFLKKQEKK